MIKLLTIEQLEESIEVYENLLKTISSESNTPFVLSRGLCRFFGMHFDIYPKFDLDLYLEQWINPLGYICPPVNTRSAETAKIKCIEPRIKFLKHILEDTKNNCVTPFNL